MPQLTVMIQVKLPGQSVLLGIKAPVYCLSLGTTSGNLAVGVGPEVHVARKISSSQLNRSFCLGNFSLLHRAICDLGYTPQTRFILQSLRSLGLSSSSSRYSFCQERSSTNCFISESWNNVSLNLCV